MISVVQIHRDGCCGRNNRDNHSVTVGYSVWSAILKTFSHKDLNRLDHSLLLKEIMIVNKILLSFFWESKVLKGHF